MRVKWIINPSNLLILQLQTPAFSNNPKFIHSRIIPEPQIYCTLLKDQVSQPLFNFVWPLYSSKWDTSKGQYGSSWRCLPPLSPSPSLSSHPFHSFPFPFFFFCAGVGTQGLAYAKHMLSHWTIRPTPGSLSKRRYRAFSLFSVKMPRNQIWWLEHVQSFWTTRMRHTA